MDYNYCVNFYNKLAILAEDTTLEVDGDSIAWKTIDGLKTIDEKIESINKYIQDNCINNDDLKTKMHSSIFNLNNNLYSKLFILQKKEEANKIIDISEKIEGAYRSIFNEPEEEELLFSDDDIPMEEQNMYSNERPEKKKYNEFWQIFHSEYIKFNAIFNKYEISDLTESKFRALLEKIKSEGFQIRALQNEDEADLLHMMAQCNAPAYVFSILKEENLNPNFQETDWKNTPLIWAIANASNDAALEIIDCWKDTIDLNIKCRNGNTALHLSVAKGYKNIDGQGGTLNRSNLEIVSSLTNNGCDVNLQNDKGYTPLHYACLRRDVEMIKVLLDHGAQNEIRDNQGRSPKDLLELTRDEAAAILEKDTINLYFISKEEEYNNDKKVAKQLIENKKKAQ